MTSKQKNPTPYAISVVEWLALITSIMMVVVAAIVASAILDAVESTSEDGTSFHDEFANQENDAWQEMDCLWFVEDGEFVQSRVYETLHCRQMISGLDITTPRISADVIFTDYPYIETDARWSGIFLQEQATGTYYHLFLDACEQQVVLTKSCDHELLGKVTYPIEPETVYHLQLDLIDNRLIGFVNGDPIIVATDIESNTINSAGIYIIEGTARFDNIDVAQIPLSN